MNGATTCFPLIFTAREYLSQCFFSSSCRGRMNREGRLDHWTRTQKIFLFWWFWVFIPEQTSDFFFSSSRLFMSLSQPILWRFMTISFYLSCFLGSGFLVLWMVMDGWMDGKMDLFIIWWLWSKWMDGIGWSGILKPLHLEWTVNECMGWLNGMIWWGNGLIEWFYDDVWMDDGLEEMVDVSNGGEMGW